MKRILLFLTPLFLFSCSDNDSPELFTPEILARQVFSIDPSKDTVLETLHGSRLRVVAGSFSVTGTVKLEIKEAFTPAEILASGMTTESNGRPLRSGGMIYINAKGVDLLKPIKVSVPNSYYDSAMQIFKGVETDSGTVNWVEPIPIVDTAPQAKNWQAGKLLFQRSCNTCHGIFTDGIGPALMNLTNRGPWRNRQKIYEWVRNPAAFMETSIYAQKLISRFNNQLMQSFPLSNKQIDQIIDYINTESKRPEAREEEDRYNRHRDSLHRRYLDSLRRVEAASPLLYDTTNILDKSPCGVDTVYIRIPKDELTSLDTVANDPSPAKDIPSRDPNQPIKAEEMEGLRKGFTDPNPTNGMYDFEIKTFGWYNVDAYVEGYDGTKNVKLWAQLQADFDIDMHVYLFCPRNKMLSVAYEKRGNKYFFNKINGGIPLFLNDRAILFAFGSKGDNMYYGISEFRVKSDQTISVTIKVTTDKEIRQALLSKQIEGIDLGIEQKEKLIVSRNCDDVPVTDSSGKKQ